MSRQESFDPARARSHVPIWSDARKPLLALNACASEVRDDAILFPVAVTNRIRTSPSADFLCRSSHTIALEAPSLYDEFLRFLSRAGFAIPASVLERDVTLAHVFTPELVPVFRQIYEGAHDADALQWRVYEACEELVDLEDNFHFWRFRHMRTVNRTIGIKAGTGGSSGVDFLKRALDLTFFPELFAVRTEIGAS